MNDSLYKSIAFLGLAVLLAILGYYYRTYLEGVTPSVNFSLLVHFLILLVIIAVSLSLYLTNRMLIIAKQDRLFELQQIHMQQLEEMMNIVKTQRHDFVNHFQTIYGLLQLEEVHEAKKFISDLYQEIVVTGDVLHLAIPELSALLFVKMGTATNKNISFYIDIESDLAKLSIRPIDMVSILGNLLNNALEAVEGLDGAERRLSLKIFEDSLYYVIQVDNPGFIPEEIKAKIFTAGFSTRSEHKERGLGLASIKNLVEKHGGKIILSTNPEKDVRFTVCLPKQKGKKQ